MKLPVWLKIALALTVVAVLWSLCSEAPAEPETVEPQTPLQQPVNESTAARAETLLSINDLFPYQGPTVKTPPPPKPVTVAKPHAPTLPFRLSGAWWQGNKHVLVLSDGKQSWLICRQCNLAGAIRSGEKLTDNWQLRSIADDHLVIRWLPLENDQRLPLGEMQSKPKF